IEPLRATPETVPLQRDDDCPQAIALAADPGDLRLVPRALGDEQRTQRCRFGREIVEVERHVFDVSQPQCDAKSSDESNAEVSQRVAGYCVACGTRTSISRTRVQSRPSIKAESCDGVRRIVPSSMRGQRNVPCSSRLANRQSPVPSHTTSFTRSARLARNT